MANPSNLNDVYYNSIITIDNSVNNVVINVSGSILPTLSNTFSLGATGQHWKEIYVGPGSLNIQGPGGSFATLGSDSQGIAYTEHGFATPFVNIGPSQLTPSAVGGWSIGPTGTQGSVDYDLIAVQIDPSTGDKSGPSHSLVHGTTGSTGITGITGMTGLTGPAGQFTGSYSQGSSVNITANVDNLSLLSGSNSVYIITSTGNYSIYGLAGGTVGRYVVIVNDSTHIITFHNEETSSTNTNRFYMRGGGNSTTIIPNHGSITLMYVSGLTAGVDTNTSRWVVVSAMT